MSIETELKGYILSRFGSIREFSKALDMPYSTIDSIFKRGVENSSVVNINRICTMLQISADELMNGRITFRALDGMKPDETELLNNYRALSAQGKEYIRQTMYMALQTYKKANFVPGMEATAE